MIFRIIIWAILIGFVLRFIFRFLVPIFQVTSMTHSKIKQMQKQMEDMQEQSNKTQERQQKVKEGDYIDYEEVK